MKASDIRRGHVLIIDGQPCRVMDFQHRTPGNLRAFVQLRLRNLTSGNTFDTRLSATEFVEDARLDTKEMQVMYRDSNGTHVMDAQNYEQYSLDDEITGDQAQWLEPGMTFQAEWLNGRPIAIMLPATAELEVVETKKDNVVGATFVLYADQSGGAADTETTETTKPKRRVASMGG